ncbi:hypothetical protein [Bacillus cereus]|uniref:Phage protein n=1 Tax=Bacillus cereus HuA3-9 TaxID=1053205 RepID=R8CIA8_BACCE|nr:hypothetical protein [Bacillus cereus]EKS7858203.1 hypothetical protein [Bacillus cereus]EOO11332.1 hypothetical protein IGA_05595 [Bacillus cereus HuA3-9]
MIEPLRRVIIENNADGTQVTRLPNHEEVVKKVNEIIIYLNKKEILKREDRIKGLKFGSRYE